MLWTSFHISKCCLLQCCSDVTCVRITRRAEYRQAVGLHPPPPLSNSAVLGGEGESMEAGGARICTSNKSMLMLLVWAVHFESCHLHHHMNDCWLLYRVDAWIYLVVPLYLGIEIISNANNAGITILRAKPVLCFYERSASLHWDPRS